MLFDKPVSPNLSFPPQVPGSSSACQSYLVKTYSNELVHLKQESKRLFLLITPCKLYRSTNNFNHDPFLNISYLVQLEGLCAYRRPLNSRKVSDRLRLSFWSHLLLSTTKDHAQRSWLWLVWSIHRNTEILKIKMEAQHFIEWIMSAR